MMNIILQTILFIIFLLPTLKLLNMAHSIYSINAETEIKLDKSTRDKIVVIITLIGFVVSVELSVHSLSFIAYILIMIVTYFILFLAFDFFQLKLLNIIAIMVPIFAFMGYWTGILALEASSPIYIEQIIILVPFILPYIQYRLIFKKERLIELVNEYLDYITNQSHQNEDISEFILHLEEFVTSYNEYLSSIEEVKLIEKKQRLKVQHNPKKTEIFHNQSYSQIKKKCARANKFTSTFSEMLSIISGGSVAGSAEESMVRSIGYFNEFLLDSNKIQNLKLAYAEFTKSNCSVSDKLLKNYYLMFYLKYLSASPDHLEYYVKLKKQSSKFNLDWIERGTYTHVPEIGKIKLKKQYDEINEMENTIHKESENFNPSRD